ncbi:hypothetical protein CDL15_Pgr027236 [Punica granatum]|uniref:Uncharacterized protein n=1 Tax=Punica granatum TaxID=22663 RepID=A0A218WYQ1_PUNGR|nr:hypothetical protein CDL15_Pgr027236 [Punica granatum]PKI78247.1 hypothetical protein CRG98_001362 [Punica granatum]
MQTLGSCVRRGKNHCDSSLAELVCAAIDVVAECFVACQLIVMSECIEYYSEDSPLGLRLSPSVAVMCLICRNPGSPLGSYLLGYRKPALLLRNDCALPETCSTAWVVML